MANTYDRNLSDPPRERTQSMFGMNMNGSRQSAQSRVPLQLEEVDVQVHTPVRSTPQFRGPREPIVRRTEVVYESNHINFRSILTPMVGLTATASDNGPKIKFEMTRDHLSKLITLSWEPFQGSVSSSGTECVEVTQSISHLPAYIVDLAITIEVKGVRKPSFLRIDPFSNNNIKFYLDITGSGSMISDNDKVFVPASTVQWKSAD